MNEMKITIIVHQNDKEKFKGFKENVIKKIRVPYLDGRPFAVNVLHTAGEKRGPVFNKAMRQSDAKYKVYIGADVVDVEPQLLLWIIKGFLANKRMGLMGFLGSGMPLSGKAADAKNNRWGRYFRQEQVGMSFEQPLFWQDVSLIDSQVMATSVDVPWDEECGDNFLGAVACLVRRQQGIEVAVPMLPGMAYISSAPSEYDRTDMDEDAHREFLARYRQELEPLVSVLIPAYNEPDFCREALESVLAQDYGNIEILIGDDSTDDRVEKMLQPYLKEHLNIHYEHHEKPYGSTKNVEALLASCHGDYVNVLMHDDIFMPKKISTMMSYFVQDVNEDIGFVTSTRPYIMKDGKYVDDPVRLIFDKDAVICDESLAKKILQTCINVVGELSTVLFRKSLIKVEGDAKFPYRIGYFGGYKEDSMGDVSTWLHLLSQSKCVFLKEQLSAFRRSDNQNTWKPGIMIQSALDWLNLIVAAGRQGKILRTQQDFEIACQGWHDLMKPHMLSMKEKFVGDLQGSFDTFMAEIEAVEQHDYDGVVELAAANMGQAEKNLLHAGNEIS